VTWPHVCRAPPRRYVPNWRRAFDSSPRPWASVNKIGSSADESSVRKELDEKVRKRLDTRESKM